MRGTLLAVGLVAAMFFYMRSQGGDDHTPSLVATAAVADVPVYPSVAAPDPNLHLANPRTSGDPLVFLVDESVERTDDPAQTGEEWLPVHLPIRPNGATGWVRGTDVSVSRNDFRIQIDLDRHEMTLTRRGKVELETPIGVGTESTPTPGGTYFITELVKPLDADGLYGPFAYGLSGFSDQPGARDFNGGDGMLGIHGTNDPETIGQDVSHGCIRVPNDVITYMATVVPIGTPVEIS